MDRVTRLVACHFLLLLCYSGNALPPSDRTINAGSFRSLVNHIDGEQRCLEDCRLKNLEPIRVDSTTECHQQGQESFLEEWRKLLANHLHHCGHQHSVGNLAFCVPGPVKFGPDVKLVDVVRDDPMKRFELSKVAESWTVRLRKGEGIDDSSVVGIDMKCHHKVCERRSKCIEHQEQLFESQEARQSFGSKSNIQKDKLRERADSGRRMHAEANTLDTETIHAVRKQERDEAGQGQAREIDMENANEDIANLLQHLRLDTPNASFSSIAGDTASSPSNRTHTTHSKRPDLEGSNMTLQAYMLGGEVARGEVDHAAKRSLGEEMGRLPCDDTVNVTRAGKHRGCGLSSLQDISEDANCTAIKGKRKKTKYISIDVECAATGRGHNDRSPCRIAAVNLKGSVLIDIIVRVPNLFDPLTYITGLTSEQISAGVPLDEALVKLRKFCGAGVVVVGQSILNDIQWLGLQKGVDYARVVDLAEEFACHLRGRKIFHSLRNTAFGLLGVTMTKDHHDPAEDARVSIQLYKQFVYKSGMVRPAARRLRQMLLSKKFPPKDESARDSIRVCSWKNNRRKCFCGQFEEEGISVLGLPRG